MAFKLGQIVLYTQRPEELVRFLSDLLDLGIKPSRSENEIILASSKVNFCLLKAKAQHLFSKGSERDILVEFEVDALDELEDLLHKIQFMTYRQNTFDQNSSATNKIELQKSEENYFFTVQDPDGRYWKFNYSFS